MNSAALITRSALALIFLFATVMSASAQEGVYVQASAFADIRQFGSSGGAAIDLDDEFSLDATGVGGSIRVGTWLHRRWTIEAGLDLSNRTTVTFGNPFILALFPPGRQPFDLQASSSFTSVTTTIGFHQRAGDDVRLGYRAGFSFVRATYRTELLDGVRTDAIFTTSLVPNLPLLPIRLEDLELTRKENHGALVLGFEAAIEIADDLDVVPELRAFAFSRSNSGVFLIRPGAGIRWSF
ncbi:MAG: hypothetical protein EHM55_05290 [Acidobacteria bacterium]|nr:MAG: hypothetical protein EHM55_05290 [Acidobacteriota bacterium]